jgi:dUTP pyrophosphatase
MSSLNNSVLKVSNLKLRSEYDQLFLIEKLHNDAFILTKATDGSAGYDIKAFEDGVVPAMGSALIGTNIRLGIPVNHYGRVASRSGLACKHNIEVGAGVIDRDYHGELKVLLRNFSNVDYSFKRGDRIAQIIIEQYRNLKIRVVENLPGLVGRTERNDNGFGSSGV